MKYRKFANTNIELSSIGLGCMGMSAAYGQKDDIQSLATLEKSIELGINFWDTANIYGNGANEELISKILTKNRDKVFIATKFGFRMKDETKDSFSGEVYIDCSAKHIKEAIEKSLKRLNTDVIDLYYAHRIDPNTPIEETIEAMAKLVKEGKIKYLGLSECTADELKKAHAIHPISALQSEYSLLYREVEKEILPLTKELGITFVPFAPLGRGLMSNKLDISSLSKSDFRKNLPRYDGEYLHNNQKLTSELEQLAISKNATSAQLSLAWVLAQSKNIIPIPGTKKIKYLEENAKAIDLVLTKDDLEKIENILKKYPNVGPRYSDRENKFVKK
ncbi:aldo/keto reductase [Aliarcobacter butzleri]|uniref:aldo/keto reductase n=1 Tax=Aliarcobacter butzleri TaxID=28197 RepID=UPI00344B9AF0